MIVDRRRYLATALGTVCVGMGGCLDALEGAVLGGWSPDVHGEEPELSPGDEGAVRVETSDVQSLRISPEGDAGLRADGSDPVQLAYHEVSPTPAPDDVLHSLPPAWVWDEKTTVEVSVPVYVTDDAKAGAYPYSVNIYEKRNMDGESERVEFTITVLER